jgi:hypothetical protein
MCIYSPKTVKIRQKAQMDMDMMSSGTDLNIIMATNNKTLSYESAHVTIYVSMTVSLFKIVNL